MDTIKINKGNAKMIAHRGLSGIERENTNAAFIAAGNRSYWGIETDLYRTCDGHFVICHDTDTKRVSGDRINIEESTYESVRAIRLYDKNGKKRNDLRIPDLEEYIDTCVRYEKHCVLELKSVFTLEEMQRIIDIIKEKNWLDMVLFISFHYENLEKVRELLPQQPCQWLYGLDVSEEQLARLEKDKIGLDIQYSHLTKEVIDRVHSFGQECNVWICNIKEEAERLIALGCDYITGDILE